MNIIISKLDVIRCDINNIDVQKREKKYFLSLESLKQKNIELKNLKILNEELNQLNVDECAEKEKVSIKIENELKNLQKLITDIENEKDIFSKISNINLLKI
jgi:hypothetical protein